MFARQWSATEFLLVFNKFHITMRWRKILAFDSIFLNKITLIVRVCYLYDNLWRKIIDPHAKIINNKSVLVKFIIKLKINHVLKLTNITPYSSFSKNFNFEMGFYHFIQFKIIIFLRIFSKTKLTHIYIYLFHVQVFWNRKLLCYWDLYIWIKLLYRVSYLFCFLYYNF